MRNVVRVFAVAMLASSMSGCFTLNWNHNRRHLRKFITQIRDVHKDIDRVVFDLDPDPND
jgi:hypothetical protein